MIASISKLDERLKVLKALYTDPTAPMESRHVFELVELLELSMLTIAVLEMKLKQEVG